jgi:hypothetical protein
MTTREIEEELPSRVRPGAGTSDRLATLKAKLVALADTDLTRRDLFAVLALFFYLLRLPYINEGYGTDPDAWRVVMTAQHLWDTGQYFPSRLPGNPLHEFVVTLLLPGGWILTGLATMTVSLVGVYLFGRILKQLNLPMPGLMMIGFAFTPLLYINSIATMDYMWALTCLLGSYYCVLTKRPLLAGVLLGLAIGFRMQGLSFLPPMAILLWRTDRLRELPVFVAAAAGTSMLAYAPVFVVYGVTFVNFYDAPIPYRDVIALLGKEALGIFGGLGVLAGAVLSWRQLVNVGSDLKRDAIVLSWLAVIAFYLFSFLRLPHEIAYLIPIFPFGMMIMARYYTRTALTVAMVAIMVAGIIDITTPGVGLQMSDLKNARPGRGLVLSNKITQDGQEAFAKQVMSDEIPNHSVVMIGYIFPEAAVRNHDRLELRVLQRDYEAISMLSDRGEAYDAERDIRYVWLLPYESFVALQSQGYSFYVVPDAEGGVYALYKYRPMLYGASPLRLETTVPSKSKGSGSKDR